MISIFLFGDFWNRQPLAYPRIRDRLADRIEFVEDPADAQIALFSHSHDLTRHGTALAGMMARWPNLRAVLLSEEPFWDTCWAPDPFSRFQTWGGGAVPFAFAQVNHFTSDVFDCTSVPYFLLTDPKYIAHYRPMFDRNAGLSAADWQAQWRAAAWDAVFMAERRDGDRHGPSFSDHAVWGLSVLRSRIARHCQGAAILRAGKGWDSEPHRTELPDWHADKLARLDRQCRYVSAIENTHQANYVTEKIFDAFAVGGVPLYVATKGHDVTRYAGPGSWINLEARLPQKDAPKSQPFDGSAPVSADMAAAYVASQNRLAKLFSQTATVERELDQVSDRLYRALRTLTL